ncbi:hypothetical protein HMPREF9374_0977 [Desmospora sp. 8437]|nr:hypothetical protein HMPREF9374_0977 [Desmospora sp. 8437]
MPGEPELGRLEDDAFSTGSWEFVTLNMFCPLLAGSFAMSHRR